MNAGQAGARIALDVMGGDAAPEAALEGAVRACTTGGEQQLAPQRVLLVGDEQRIRAALAALGGDPGFGIQHASQVIEMGESPAQALRAKPDSSIGRCVLAVREKQAGAVVSMGNTGAVVGASTLGLGTLEGIKRPGIAVTLDLTGHPCTLIDMGANIAPKPLHLRQYARMGAIYTADCLGTENPRIGLLNIGEESSKGTPLLKEAHALLEESDLNFVGNVEGTDVFLNKVDVVVADGFTGNVVLKLLEGFSGFMLQLIMAELKRHDVKWSADALSNVRKSIDYAEYGGALLLGVAGIVVIGHGKSDGGAFANALGCAARALDADVNAHIVAGVRAQTATS